MILGKKTSRIGYCGAVKYKGEIYTPDGKAGMRKLSELPFLTFVGMGSRRKMFNIEVITQHDCGYDSCVYSYEYNATVGNVAIWHLTEIEYYHY